MGGVQSPGSEPRVIVVVGCSASLAVPSFSVLIFHEFLHMAGLCAALQGRLIVAHVDTVRERQWPQRDGYRAAAALVTGLGRAGTHG